MTQEQGANGQARRRPALWFSLSALAILFVTFAPLISALSASIVAESHGCALDEGGVHPCVVGGTDIGEWLALMFVSGWFMFFTAPLGFGAAIIWALVLLIFLIRRVRK